jgi:hypothetical protein
MGETAREGTMSKVDIEELVNKIKGGGGGGGDDNNMTEQQQADQLRDVFVHHTHPPDLKPGDYVRYRSECHAYIRTGSRLHIVLEKLADPLKVPVTDDSIGGPVAYRVYDTLIGVTDKSTKGCVLKYYADSRELEPWPDGDRLKRDAS